MLVIGIAFGDGNGILFEKGEKVFHGAAEDVVERLITRASEMLADQKKA
jgi:spore coat polysaccharide biosynthesis protein SpsF (cytidylyltransferase family)